MKRLNLIGKKKQCNLKKPQNCDKVCIKVKNTSVFILYILIKTAKYSFTGGAGRKSQVVRFFLKIV